MNQETNNTTVMFFKRAWGFFACQMNQTFACFCLVIYARLIGKRNRYKQKLARNVLGQTMGHRKHGFRLNEDYALINVNPGGGGGVVLISSDGDDRMGAKIETKKKKNIRN